MMKRLRSTAVALAGAMALLETRPASAHVEADGLIVTENGRPVVHVWQATVMGQFDVPFQAPTPRFDVTFLDPDSVLFVPGPPGHTWLKHFFGTPGVAEYDSLGAWSFALRGLQQDTDGNIRLRIWFETHYDYTSPPIPFRVHDALDVSPPTVPTIAFLTAFPNPMQGSGEIQYVLEEAGEVVLTLHDITGRQLFTLDAGNQGVGFHAMALEPGRLSNGIYVLQLRTGAAVAQRKVQILR